MESVRHLARKLGVDLGMMHTVGDLQGGLEEAERLLVSDSYSAERSGAAKPSSSAQA